MQAWRMRALLLAIIVLLPFEIMLLIALWPYLPWVGKAFMGFLVTCFVCGSAAVIDWAWKRIRAPRVIVSGEVVVLMRNGQIEHLSARHEEAKRPLMLAPPAKEEKDEAIDPKTAATVKELFETGHTLRTIAQSTGLTYYKVQKLCEPLRNN